MSSALDEQSRSDVQAPADSGIWLFVLGDMSVFLALFFSVVLARRADPVTFAEGSSTLSLPLGTLNTVLLITSSMLVAAALHRARQGMDTQSAGLIAAAFGCAMGFVGVKALEWHSEISAGAGMRVDSFYDKYFAYTGLHLLHVLIGMVVLAWMFGRVRRGGLDARAQRAFTNGAVYWHMVDLLWIVLFSLLYISH